MNMHSRRPLSLTNLRAFEAVARLLSFGAAADELYLTQSAISRQIKGLEDELGAALFVRGTRSVQISPDGQTLLRAVEPWLAKLDSQRPADPPLAQPAPGERRHLRVVRLALAAAAASRPSSASIPDIDIRVSAHDAIADLDDPELDLALRYLNPAQVPRGRRCTCSTRR